VRCHLLPRQVIRREHPARSIVAASLAKQRGIEPPPQPVDVNDPRSWVWGCGGIMGPGGHHGQFKPDGPRPIPRDLLPPGLIEFAEELGLGWYIERTYPLEEAA
jgi:hypothetical protein